MTWCNNTGRLSLPETVEGRRCEPMAAMEYGPDLLKATISSSSGV
jgi:hypothetical protein